MHLAYISGLLTVSAGDTITITVDLINHNDVQKESIRLRLFGQTSFDPLIDEHRDLGPRGIFSSVNGPLNPGSYWVEVGASEFVVVSAAIRTLEGGRPIQVVSYSPGDFAVFESGRRRR